MTAQLLMDVIHPFVSRGAVPGAVVGVWRDGEVSLEAAGTGGVGGGSPLTVDTLVRISSNTKPMVAAVTLALVEAGVLALADPVERFVPELAARRVLQRVDGPVEDTVPADRPVTIEDLLTMRLGFGFVLDGDCPALGAAAEAGLGIGPPDPSVALTPDEWVAAFARLPLLEQPGTVWRYDLAYGVLGVVLARAAGVPLAELLLQRLFTPLGMADTAFVAPPGRLPPSYALDRLGLALFDGAEGSRWAEAPLFPDARGGLVSTAADLLRFAAALLDGGAGVLSVDSVTAMTTNHLSWQQRAGSSAQAFLGGAGWGYGVHIVSPDYDRSARLARYGWGGGLGTLWYSWPKERTAAVLLTQVLPPTPDLIGAFTTGMVNILSARDV